MAKSRLAAIVLAVVGMLLLVVSGLLPTMLPTRYFWSEEQAREQSAAASRHHQAKHELEHIHTSPTSSDSAKLHPQQQAAAARAGSVLARHAAQDPALVGRRHGGRRRAGLSVGQWG
jgi:hypothetical protein